MSLSTLFVLDSPSLTQGLAMGSPSGSQVSGPTEAPPIPLCHQLLTTFLSVGKNITCLKSGKEKTSWQFPEHRHLGSYFMSGARVGAKLEGGKRPRRHCGQNWCG